MFNQTHQDAEAIFRAGLKRVDSRAVIHKVLSLEGSVLRVRTESVSMDVDLNRFERILVMGVGKATARMALGLVDILGPRIDSGLIVVKHGHTEDLPSSIKILEASHPMPDHTSERAANELFDYCRSAGPKDLVIGLISGGGSALVALPAEGIELKDKQEMTKHLLARGVSIHDINGIRKHLSRIKGGLLAKIIQPATSLNLILSDVIGDDLDTIASGLTVPDSTSYHTVWNIVEKHRLHEVFPPNVLRRLEDGVKGQAPETPKPGDESFEQVHNVIVGSNYQAVLAAGEEAERRGYKTMMLTSALSGEARELAHFFLACARDAYRGLPAHPPLCVIAGGETTVTLRGKGLGGRNQEMALSYLAEFAKLRVRPEKAVFLSASTDGSDGPTDAAGAFASLEIMESARRKGLSWRDFLERNDSYHFFEALGALLKTGPTNTNVCDLQILLVPK